MALAAPKTYCVKSGSGDGCKSTISAALALANSGDTIRVAGGTYTESVTITKSVKLLGGWNSTFTKRNPATHLTTIQAPASPPASVVTITGVFGDTPAVAPHVDGFTITGGNPGNHGGGMRITNSDARISNNDIKQNIGYLLGGGVWVQNGSPAFTNNRIEQNHVTTAGSVGGGIELENTTATLKNNVVDANVGDDVSGYGGGIGIQDGNVNLVGNTVSNNAAATLPGGASDLSYGGGISVRNAKFSLTGGHIQGNTANSAALNARGNGGGIYVSGSSEFAVSGTSISQNTAGQYYSTTVYLLGGGALIDSSTGSMENVDVTTNQTNRAIAIGNGGGIAVMNSTLDVGGGVISDNKTAINNEGYGGGVYAKDSNFSLDATVLDNNGAANTPSYGLGGGFAFVNTPFVLSNAIVTNNWAFNSDTAVGGLNADAKSLGVIVNCTFAANRGQAIRTATGLLVYNTIITDAKTGIDATGGSAALRADDFYNNTTNTKNATIGPSNLTVNPQLDGTFHLPAGSPAIDAATKALAPDHDIDGQLRPMIGTSGKLKFDIGADERKGP